MSEHVSAEAAEQLVQEVSSWCVEQIIKERRSDRPDAGRLEALQEELTGCAADTQALQDADEEGVAEIASRYAARLKELQGE